MFFMLCTTIQISLNCYGSLIIPFETMPCLPCVREGQSDVRASPGNGFRKYGNKWNFTMYLYEWSWKCVKMPLFFSLSKGLNSFKEKRNFSWENVLSKINCQYKIVVRKFMFRLSMIKCIRRDVRQNTSSVSRQISPEKKRSMTEMLIIKYKPKYQRSFFLLHF